MLDLCQKCGEESTELSARKLCPKCEEEFRDAYADSQSDEMDFDED